MRRILCAFLLFISVQYIYGQTPTYQSTVGSATFTFFYSGPTEIAVDDDCEGVLDWGHPATPTVEYDGPGMLTSFDIISISGGYQMGDQVPAGETVQITYRAEDDLGNFADFSFSITFVDEMPPIFDPVNTPPDIVVECINQIPGENEIDVSDNCDPDGNSITVTIDGTAPDDICLAQDFTRTITATDVSGNSATLEQNVIVLADTSAPTIINFPRDDSADCELVSFQYDTWLDNELAFFLAEDIGCNNINYYYEAPVLSEIEDSCGIIEASFYAEDICGNITESTATFTILDEVSPSLTEVPSDLVVDCNMPDAKNTIDMWLNNHGGAVADDNCTDVQWSYSPDTINFEAACSNPLTVEFTATDDCGNSIITAATLEIQDTTPPTILNEPGTITEQCDSTDSVSKFEVFLNNGSGIEFNDYCSPIYAFQYQYITAADTLTVDELINAFQNTLQAPCLDTVINGENYNNVTAFLSYRVIIADACGNKVVSDTVNYIVQDLQPPILNSSARDTSFYCTSTSQLINNFTNWYESGGGADVVEYCGPVIVESSPSRDSLLNLLNSGNFSCNQGIELKFEYEDACGNYIPDTTTITFTIKDTIAPVITAQPNDITVNCSPSLDTSLQQWINNYASANVTDDCSEEQWLYFTYANDSAGMIQGEFNQGPYPEFQSNSCRDSIAVTFIYGDQCSNLDSFTSIFTVIDTIPPEIVNFQDTISVDCATIPGEEAIEVEDNCQSNVMIDYIDDITRQGDSTECRFYNYSINRTYIVTDNCGFIDSAQQVLIVMDNTPPSFTVPDSTIVECGSEQNLDITGHPTNITDACNSPVEITYRDSVIAYGCNSSIIRIWTATDACMNTTKKLQFIGIEDNIAPEYMNLPVDTAIYCEMGTAETYEDWVGAQLRGRATDSCGIRGRFAALPGSYNLDDPATFPDTLPVWDNDYLCTINKGDTIASVEVEYVLFDSCYNTSVYTSQFAVIDTIPPSVDNCPTDSVLYAPSSTCEVIYKIPELRYGDECSDSLSDAFIIASGDTLQVNDGMTDSIVLSPGMHEFQFYVSDCAENIADCNWTVNVLDTIAPELSCDFDSTYILNEVDCYQNIVLDNFTVRDNCDEDSLSNSYTLIRANGDTTSGTLPLNENVSLGTGTHRFIFTVSDASANVSTCISTIEVLDTIAPVAGCKPAFITVYPDGQTAPIDVDDFNLNSTDNCTLDSLWIYPSKFDCSQAGNEVDVTLYVQDASGNIDSCTTIGKVELAIVEPTYEVDLCDPDTLRLFANPPGGDTTQYIYSWGGPQGFSSTQQNPIIPDIDSSNSGTYIVKIEGPTACSISGEVNVNINTLDQPELTISADTICENNELTLESSIYNGNVTYEWYEGVPPTGVLLGSTDVPVFTINPLLGEHRYYVIVRNAQCETNPSVLREVDVIEVPVAEVQEAFINVCAGDEIQLESTNTGPSINYQWNGPNGFSSTLKNPLVTSDATQADAGIYNLTISIGKCISESIPVEVQVNSLPPQPSISGDTVLCEGEELRLISTNPNQYDSYLWENEQGEQYSTDNPLLIISEVAEIDSGLWTVSVKVGKCTSMKSESFNVDVKPLPDIKIIYPSTVCEEDSIALIVESDIGNEFIWVNPTGDTLIGKEVTYGNHEGQYSVTTISQYGCTAHETVQIDVITKPTITALSSTAPDCIDSIVNITFEPTVFPGDNGNYNYKWIFKDTIIGMDSTLTLQSATIQDTGTYMLVVGIGGCQSDTFRYDLKMEEIPPVAEILSRTFYCETENVLIRLKEYNPENTVYKILVNGEEYTTDTSILNLGMLTPGTYDVSASILNGNCEGPLSEEIEITVGDAPQPNSIQGTTQLCEGDTIRLRASGVNGDFVWFLNGDSLITTDRTLEISSADLDDSGYYTVRQKLAGCFSATGDSIYVRINKTPSIPQVESILDGICISTDTARLEICLSNSSYSDSARYQWYHLGSGTEIGTFTADSCQSIFDFKDFQDGMNELYVTSDINGCYAPANDTISAFVSVAPDETADGGNDIFACDGDFPALDATASSLSQAFWQVLTDSAEISSLTDPQAAIKTLATGENIFVWSLSYGSCSNFSTDTVRVYYDVPPLAENDEYIKPFGSSFNMDILDNDDITGGVEITVIDDVENGRATVGSSTIQYTPANGYIGEDSLTYRICSVNCLDACSSATVSIQIGDESLCNIPTIFTPNNDGTNDFFTIQCLSSENYPDNVVKVFNQYGDEVFQAAPYKNDWDGTYDGKPLPVGTYFYVMDFGDGRKIEKGFVLIER